MAWHGALSDPFQRWHSPDSIVASTVTMQAGVVLPDTSPLTPFTFAGEVVRRLAEKFDKSTV